MQRALSKTQPPHQTLTVTSQIKGQQQQKKQHKCNVTYKIPCLSCNYTYIGETGRPFGTQKKEPQKECEKKTANRQMLDQRSHRDPQAWSKEHEP